MAKNLFEFLIEISDIIKGKFTKNMPENAEKTAVHKFSKSISRTFLTRNESLFLNAGAKLKIQQINNNAKEIFKKHFENLDDLLTYIESQGTLVVKAPHMEKVLILLGENEGFLTPLKGIKAFLLILAINILSSKKLEPGFSTPAMFIMRNKPANFYYMAHQFHHWLTYINGLPGYEEKTTENFRSIWSSEFGSSDINAMSIDEILSLKEAISRDLEAIKFVKEMCRELIGARESSKRLIKGESLNI